MVALPTTYTASWTNLVYTPSGTGNQKQKLNIFLPTGPAPRDGWPCLVYTNMSGWSAVSLPSTINRTNGTQCLSLREGIAVAWVSITISGTLGSSGAVISGKGFFKDPGVPEFGTQDFSDKDMCLAVQYLRRYAKTYRLNPDLLFGMGGSAGADAVLYSAYGQNRAGQTGFWSDANTRLNGAIVSIFQYFWRGHRGDIDIGFYHFPSYVNTSPYDGFPAGVLGAAQPGIGDSTWIDNHSPAKYAFESPGVIALNKTQKLYMWSSNATTNTNFREGYSTGDWNGGTGYTAAGEVANGWPSNASGLSDIHSSWHEFMFKRELERNSVQFAPNGPKCRLVVTPQSKPTWAAPKPQHDLLISSKDQTVIGQLTRDQVDWLHDNIRAA